MNAKVNAMMLIGGFIFGWYLADLLRYFHRQISLTLPTECASVCA